MKEEYEEYLKEFQESFGEPIKNKEPAIICDIDGTLALMKGKRTPFDYRKCYNDELNVPVLQVINCLMNIYNYKLLLVSARENVTYEEDEAFIMHGKKHTTVKSITEVWLKDHNIEYSALFMRDEGNYRKDRYVKYDMYRSEILPYYDVKMVFDDRDQVVEMWRHGANLTCFQVADGRF